MLGINDYQKKAHETASYPFGAVGDADKCCRTDWLYPVMGLAEEAGEVAGKFAKAIRDDNGFLSDERKEAVQKELGDVCWFVAEICTNMDWSLEDIMQMNLDKLASRKARGVIHGSGDNR